ncbi:anti-sigma factor [Natronincola ferrireducens]|uniref:Zinc-finger n=1 Tax=Natronincola ferrireducens TaxID=393762 RepID=A0A1G9GH09_9FIRM|nr:zf-HC2 domain-containing protein [Natronincola ferrireducens]SDK99969.1 hypothetical protein SAMN05660472_02418 [Natronincola ferrireducens]
MNKISCETCIDLMPLVKDGVASEDSRKLVLEHLQDCGFCKIEYEKSHLLPPPMDEERVLKKLKSKLFRGVLAIIIVGALFGIGLTESEGMFYNIIIMPLIGGISYFALKKTAYYVPIGVFILSYGWSFIRYSIAGIFLDVNIINALVAPAFWGLIYGGLCLLGVVIGVLLKFAFRKEVEK